MTPKQTNFILILLAFIVAVMIFYFNCKQKEKFNQKCKNHSECADGLKCIDNICKID